MRMDQFLKSYKNSGHLHHAYFFVGPKDKIIQKLVEFSEKNLKIKLSGNPDFKVLRYENLTIDDARFISELHSQKNIGGGLMIFIISADFISLEAQNSLLKVFEEPAPSTHFFIVMPQNVLIPTLCSRMQIINILTEESKTGSILKMSLGERIARVKDLTSAISDEESTKQDAITFLNNIEKEIYKLGTKEAFLKLKACESARDSLYDRGAPIKMVLENLVLSI